MSTAPGISTLKELVGQSVPDLAGKPFSKVDAAGTDNVIYRVGERHALRVAREHGGIPSLAYREPVAMRSLHDLPLETPELVAHGLMNEPDGWPWLICTWLKGNSLESLEYRPTQSDASRLALFLLELQGQKRDFAAAPNHDNHWRGIDLVRRDQLTRMAISDTAEDFDAIALLAIWQAALDAPACRDEDRTWIHGDLHPGNLLVGSKGISSVIDWGLSGLGDPACDMMAGFTVFDEPVRDVFWQATGITDAVWKRARGWALSTAVIAYAFHNGTRTPIVERTRRLLDEFSGFKA